MTPRPDLCPFCGEEHEGVPTDSKGKFEKGPDGQPFRIEPEAPR